MPFLLVAYARTKYLVAGIKSVRLLVKTPVVPVSVVFLLSVVGAVAVCHTTPRAVIGDPPSVVILPPLVAVVWVIVLAGGWVVFSSVGAVASSGGVGVSLHVKSNATSAKINKGCLKKF